MIQYKGITENVSDSIVGIVTRNPFSLSRGKGIFVSDNPTILSSGFAAYVTDGGRTKKASLVPKITIDKAFLDKLVEGDCVLIDKDGVITVVWEKSAVMNPLLLTEMCDCRCRMCPQPPKLHDETLNDICKRILGLIRVEASQTICLTGGEPTLLNLNYSSKQ